MRVIIVCSVALTVVLFATASLGAENLIAFVGEKISVTEFEPKLEPNVILLDSAFQAKYRVIEVVYGSYKGDQIEFDAFDHYGRPGFEGHRYVLLFVSSASDAFYHQKYQYFAVFKTKSGVWAGCGDPYDSDWNEARGSVVPRALDFGTDAYFDIGRLNRSEIRKYFPAKYFRVRGGKAFCTHGNDVHELFEVKKHGVLKERGLFDEAGNPILDDDEAKAATP